MPLTACIRRPKLSDIQSSKMTGGVFRVAPGMFHPALAFSPSSLRELKHVSLPSFLAFFPSSSSMSTPCDLLAECVSDFSRSRLSHVMPRVFKRRSLSHFRSSASIRGLGTAETAPFLVWPFPPRPPSFNQFRLLLRVGSLQSSCGVYFQIFLGRGGVQVSTTCRPKTFLGLDVAT